MNEIINIISLLVIGFTFGVIVTHLMVVRPLRKSLTSIIEASIAHLKSTRNAISAILESAEESTKSVISPIQIKKN